MLAAGLMAAITGAIAIADVTLFGGLIAAIGAAPMLTANLLASAAMASFIHVHVGIDEARATRDIRPGELSPATQS